MVIRVEKKKNFVAMSNYHLKDKSLSLKAKGLLSLILSLPDNWQYNQKGLASLSTDGLDSIRSTLKELESHGYVTRKRIRSPEGFLGPMEYTIREIPLGAAEA